MSPTVRQRLKGRILTGETVVSDPQSRWTARGRQSKAADPISRRSDSSYFLDQLITGLKKELAVTPWLSNEDEVVRCECDL
jgi:hypothetical protein